MKKLNIPLILSILVHCVIIAVFALLSEKALEELQKEKHNRPIIAEIIPQEKLPQPKTKPVPPPPQLKPQPPLKDLRPPKKLSEERSSQPPGMKTTPGASASRSPQADTKDQGLQKVPLERPLMPVPERKQAVAPPSPPTTSLRKRLFDRDVIGSLAQKKNTEEGTGNGITFDPDRIRSSGYWQRILERIRSTAERIPYPPEAAEKGWQGEAIVIITITKNGRLAAIELEKSSGYKVLDDKALKVLKDAEPYWPLPDDWKQDSVTFEFHYIFDLYGFYVR
ncbi:MAG: TonB family protein [Thermodesulfovibrionales bacterium]|jgi:protein TonB